jgi:phosphohistidine phosphatase
LKTLHLLRHAKSDWGDDSLPDAERPLNARGKRDARALAGHLARHPVAVDAVYCSTARRARKTLAAISPSLGKAREVVEGTLYGAGAGDLLELVRGLDPKLDAVLLVGHNPGFEELARTLLPDSEPPRAFPTCTLASLTFEGKGWNAVKAGRGRLAGFLTPADFA